MLMVGININKNYLLKLRKKLRKSIRAGNFSCRRKKEYDLL